MYDSPSRSHRSRRPTDRRTLAPTVVVAVLLTAGIALVSLGPAAWAFSAGVAAGGLAAWATVRRLTVADGGARYRPAGLDVEIVVSETDSSHRR